MRKQQGDYQQSLASSIYVNKLAMSKMKSTALFHDQLHFQISKHNTYTR